MINGTDFELQPLSPVREQAAPPKGQFQNKVVSTSEMSDEDHIRLNRSVLKRAGDTIYENVGELLRFNISQPLINFYDFCSKSSDPTKAAIDDTIQQHMQSLFEGDYKKFTSYTAECYLSRTNENIFGQDEPLIAGSVKSSFTDVIKSIILGHQNISPSDKEGSPPEQDEKATFDLKLARLLDLASTEHNVRFNEFAAAQLDLPHVPTPATIIARLSQRIRDGKFNPEALLKQLQSECEQFTDFLLQSAGMSTYVKSLQIESTLNSSKSKAQIAARYINQSAAFLSNNVPPFYLSILGVVLLERLSAGDLKADALDSMMKAPAFNISAPVREEVVAFARNLYRAEKIDNVSQKPGNVVTTSMAFTLYVTGSLQLLISQADRNASNSALMQQCFRHFLAKHQDSEGDRLDQIKTEPTRSGFNAAANSLIRGIGITSIGLRAIMNGAYEVKDATPDTPLRDKIYNSVLGKSFVPLSLIENAGYKDDLIKKNKEVLLQRCLVKDVLNQPMSHEEMDFMKAIKGEPGTNYDFKSATSKFVTFTTTIASMAALGADIGFALATPEASKEFWGTFALENLGVTFNHIYKGAVRPTSALLNLAQVRWVSGSSGYSRHDVEAFVHIASRLFLATAPLIMWEEGLTLWDSIAAMIDTAITVGEDSAASRSINKGQLAKCIEEGVNSLRLEALEKTDMPIPDSTGRYVDELVQGLVSKMLDGSYPEDGITQSTRDELPGLSKRRSTMV